MKRILTGRWYIKRKLFGFVIMVQVKYDSFYPEIPTKYEKATKDDLAALNIKIY